MATSEFCAYNSEVHTIAIKVLPPDFKISEGRNQKGSKPIRQFLFINVNHNDYITLCNKAFTTSRQSEIC
jgi:hypothetical protein